MLQGKSSICISHISLEKNPDLSKEQRHIFDSLFKRHLTRDNSLVDKIMRQRSVQSGKIKSGYLRTFIFTEFELFDDFPGVFFFIVQKKSTLLFEKDVSQ